MRSGANKGGRRALALLPLWFCVLGCGPAAGNTAPHSGIVLTGSYDEADVLYRPGRKDAKPTRRLTEDEYNAIRKFLQHGRVQRYSNVAPTADAGAVAIDGRRFRMLQHSFYEDSGEGRLARIVVDGVEFTLGHEAGADFTQMIEWATDR